MSIHVFPVLGGREKTEWLFKIQRDEESTVRGRERSRLRKRRDGIAFDLMTCRNVNTQLSLAFSFVTRRDLSQ